MQLFHKAFLSNLWDFFSTLGCYVKYCISYAGSLVILYLVPNM